jgi:UDP-glucose 4-epimerase
MNILITGGAGFIGSNAVEYFIKKGYRVTVLDNLLSGRYENIKQFVDDGKIDYINNDIRDETTVKRIFSNGRIDICVNFAALVSVAESTENPQLTEDINVKGLINLLRYGGENRLKVFVHASSAAVYGDSQELPKIETMIPQPKSPYAISKITGEYYNRYFSTLYSFKAINCRFFNVFGQKQSPDSQYAAAVPIFIKRAVKNSEIIIYGDGEQTRDFIYVNDLISAIDFLIDNSLAGREFEFPAFNLGYGSFITINNLAKKIVDITKSKSAIRYESPRPGDIKLSYASTEKIMNLGWGRANLIGFDAGLKKTIGWYEKNIT